MDLMNSYQIFFHRWSYFWILNNQGPVGIQNKDILILGWTSKQQVLPAFQALLLVDNQAEPLKELKTAVQNQADPFKEL